MFLSCATDRLDIVVLDVFVVFFSETRPGAGGDGTLTAEFLELRGEHEGLRDDVEVFEAVHLLHPLDVFVQPVFAGQFVRSGTKEGGRREAAVTAAGTSRGKPA